jgi:hypothetical protein
MHLAKMDSRGWPRYRHRMRLKQQLQPEKKLMLAVLEDALTRFERHLPCHDRLFREELNWFMDMKSEPVFSFENICDSLQLDPTSVRKYLLRSAMVATKSLGSAREPRPDRSGMVPFAWRRMLERRSAATFGESFFRSRTRGFYSRIFALVRASHQSPPASPSPRPSTKRRNV